MKKATIITIGDELLIGQVVDTNSVWLGKELTKIGFSVDQKITISDSEKAIIDALDVYHPISDLIFITGGLGPTKDDITKKVLAEYFDTVLIHSVEVLEDVEAFIRYRGSRMNALNQQQALVPEKATVLRNKQGTAPGMWFSMGDKVIVSVPGVPSEMKGIFNQEVKNRLIQHFQLSQIVYKTVLITGIAEAHLAEKLEEWENSLPKNIAIAYLPSPGVIRLRLGIAGGEKEDLVAVLNKHIETLFPFVSENIFGFDEDTLPKIIANHLLQKRHTISTAESCTGGNIAHEFTLLSGSSSWYKGSVIAYDNQVKINQLIVEEALIDRYGAVSQQVVESMAKGVRAELNTDYAIASSGIAGPDGGTEEKPVGTVWIGIAGPNFVKSKKFIFGKDRAINIKLATTAAINYLRKELL